MIHHHWTPILFHLEGLSWGYSFPSLNVYLEAILFHCWTSILRLFSSITERLSWGYSLPSLNVYLEAILFHLEAILFHCWTSISRLFSSTAERLSSQLFHLSHLSWCSAYHSWKQWKAVTRTSPWEYRVRVSAATAQEGSQGPRNRHAPTAGEGERSVVCVCVCVCSSPTRRK